MTEVQARDFVKAYHDAVKKKRGVTYVQIAGATGQSLQNLHNKLANGSLPAWEMARIADVLGSDLRFVDRHTGEIL